MSNIRIDIASEFKDKGFKQAEKASADLTHKFKELGRTLGLALSTRQVYQFGKASLQAFSEDEQAANRLSQSLNNLGLAFEDARVSKFISDMEAASGVLDDSLRPAMQSLLMTTGSVTKSQELMALALDMSRASGVDVASVAQDLSKAYVGQARSLSKYNTGLSQVELRTKSFGELQAYLNKQFAGQNAAYLETYAGKVSVLNVAYANMQETIGEGLVDAFQLLAGEQGIAGGTSAMDAFGDSVANVIRGVAQLTRTFFTFENFGGTIKDFAAAMLQFGGNPLLAAQELGRKNKPLFFPSGGIGSAKEEAARKKAEADAAKRAKELLALTRKQVKAQEALNKKKKEEGILGDIAKRFEMDRIQIAAALGGQINEVEKLRLQLMQAILDEDVKRAILLEGQLIQAESAAKELALLLDSLDEMVDDPFADWPGTINRIKELLQQLNIKIPIETLFAEKGLKLDQEKMQVTRLERMDVNANNVYINGQVAGAATTSSSTSGLGLSDEILDLYRKGDPTAIAAVNSHAEALAGLADADLMLAESMLAESMTGPGVTVNITIEGNVTTEQDLVDTITDQLYQYQKSGKGLLYSSVAI